MHVDTDEPRVLNISFPRGAIDADALASVLRLQREGHTAYLVGGGVRDLLLGRSPKDFDISTCAEPKRVRRLFRNARLIGRRFQIVHLRYGPRIFEVSCFRKRDVPNDGTMREPLSSENTYGTPRDDAFARDFTVNALFYDPAKEAVIDHVGGLEDLDRRILRSVGDPFVWHYEDPVRILRAAKFAGRLGFTLPDRERAAMRERAPLLDICPPSRVAEELFRLLEEGASEPAFRVLWETGVLEALFPEMAQAVETLGGEDSEIFRMLGLLDGMVLANGGLPRPFLFAMALYPIVRQRFMTRAKLKKNGPDGVGAAVEDWLHDRALKLHIPRAIRARQRVLMNLAARLLTTSTTPRRVGRLARQAAFPDTMAMLRLHHRMYGDVRDIYNTLRSRATDLGLDVVPSRHAQRREPSNGRRRRRRPSDSQDEG